MYACITSLLATDSETTNDSGENSDSNIHTLNYKRLLAIVTQAQS